MKYAKIIIITVGILELIWLAVLLWPQENDIEIDPVPDNSMSFQNRNPTYVPPQMEQPITTENQRNTTIENHIEEPVQTTDEYEDLFPIIVEDDTDSTGPSDEEFLMMLELWEDDPQLVADNLMNAFETGDFNAVLSYCRGSAKAELETSIVELEAKGISEADVARSFAELIEKSTITEVELLDSNYAKFEIILGTGKALFNLKKYDDGWYIVNFSGGPF